MGPHEPKKPFLIVLQNNQVIEEAEWKKIFALNIYRRIVARIEAMELKSSQKNHK